MKKMMLILLLGIQVMAQVNESMTITVREMRVHVVDRDGQPVRGLGPHQFTLSVQGNESDLSFFEEVDLQNPVQPDALVPQTVQEDYAFTVSDQVAKRNVVLFVDSSHLTKSNFDEVKTALREFTLNKLNPQDQVKLIHWDETLTQLTGFTQDREKTLMGLEEMPFVGRMRRELIKAQRAIDNEIKEWDVLENPELRYSYENIINQLIRQKARLKADHYRSFYLNMLSVGVMLEAMDGPKSIFLFTGGSYLEVNANFGATQDLSERLGKVLNRANATIYTMLIKPTSPVGGRPPYLQNQPPNFTNRFNQTTEFPPTETGSPDVALNTITEDNAQIETGPAAASDTTGGLFLKSYSESDLLGQLDQVQNVSSHYYRLAFATDNLKKGPKVTVKLKDKSSGWKLLYGSEFADTVPYLELPEEERAIALNAMLLYGGTYRDDLAIDWDAKVFENGSDGYRIAFMGQFEAQRAMSYGIEIGFLVLDAQKELLDLTTSEVTDLPNPKNPTFYDVLFSKELPRYLRFYARDLKTGEYTFVEKEWVDSGKKKGATGLSDILMDQPAGNQIIALNQLNFVKQGKDEAPEMVVKRSKSDPFRMGEKIYAPAVAPYRFSPGVQGFMFHLENPSKPEEGSFEVQYLVQKDEGFLKVPGRVVASWVDPIGNIHFQGQIRTEDLKPGSYILHIRVKRDATKETYTKLTRFQLQ